MFLGGGTRVVLVQHGSNESETVYDHSLQPRVEAITFEVLLELSIMLAEFTIHLGFKPLVFYTISCKVQC